MATIFDEDFSGVGSSTPATALTTDFTSITGAGEAYHYSNADAGVPAKVGSMVLNLVTVANTKACTFTFTSTTGARYARLYLYPTALPAAVVLLANFRLGATTMGSLRLNANGTVAIRGQGGGDLGTTTGAIVLNSWNRLELKVQPGVEVAARLFPGGGQDDTTPATGNSITADPGTGTNIDTFGLGHLTSGSFDAMYAQVKLDNATWVGSSATAASGGSLTDVNVTPSGVGRKNVSGAQMATVDVSVVAGGRKNGQKNGVIPTVVTVGASGLGTRQEGGAADGGASTTVNVTASAGGQRVHTGGSEAELTVEVTGAGSLSGDGFDELVIAVVAPTDSIPMSFWLSGVLVPVDLYFVGFAGPTEPDQLLTRAGDELLTRAGDPILVRT